MGGQSIDLIDRLNYHHSVSELTTSTKEQLLRVGQELFSARPYDSVSTREIAEAAQVNIAAIQYHFGSKAGLFVAAVSEMMSHCPVCRALEFLTPAPVDQIAAQKVLARFVVTTLQDCFSPQGPQAARVMWREVLSDSDERVAQELSTMVAERIFAPVHQALMGVVGALAPSRSHREHDYAVEILFGLVTGYLITKPFIELVNEEVLATPEALHERARFVLRAVIGVLSLPGNLTEQIDGSITEYV